MVARIFKLDLEEDVALQLLGAAVVLRWSALPTALQDDIVQQALAMAGEKLRPSGVDELVLRILKPNGNDTRRPSP